MKVEVNLSGDEKALLALHRMVGKEGVRMRQRALAAGARVAMRAAKRTTAFSDLRGLLRKSIRIKNVRKGRGAGGVVLLAGGKEAPHAHLVEFGHAGPQPAPPHPFLEPAALTNKDKSFEAAGRQAVKELEKLSSKAKA